jgi:PKD repeat protein
VAGIIGARRNGFGVVGVAPEAEIYSLRSFLITGTASLSTLLDAIQWAIDHKLDILNMSWGSSQASAAMKDAFQRAWDSGLILVAAAGNSGREKDTVGYPAKFDTVIAVSATDVNDEIADWSSRGPSVELAAPGVDILSTFTFPMLYEHFYEYLSGTSMAAPQVTGLAALIKSANPGISNQEVRERLHRFARDIGPKGRDNDYGYGIPQIERDPLAIPGSASPVASAGKVYRGVVGEPVRFSCKGTLDPDDNLLTYQWDFGDGASGEGCLPEHIYTIPGNYTASLGVTDQDGNSSQATAEVHIYAGIEQEPVLTAADVGYTREGDKVYHKSILQAGTLSGKTYYGLVQFNSPGVDPIRLLSAELVLTVTSTSPRDEGVITAHLFPPEIVEKWFALTYTDVDQSTGVLLDSPIVMSYLHETVANGMEHRFTVPIEAMDGFEEMFNQGSVAFRIALDSEMSSNRLTWVNPKLVVRYLGDVDKNNMPPIADAGYDQRVLSGTRVILDGSASSDFEGTALTYQWVQVAGKPVTLSSPNTATSEFTAPSGNDTLVFELTASDGIFEDTDEVKIFLNNAPAEVHRVVLTPGFENAGYVADDHPTVSMFDKRYIEVGVEFREFRGPIGMPKGIAVHAAAIQFDLGTIPPHSQIVSATLELTGAKLSPDAKLSAKLKVLSPDIDAAWGKLDYPTLTGAPVKAVLSPTIRHISLGDGKVNKFKIDPSLLEELRAANNKITFRIDGPDYDLVSYWGWFIWWSGNEVATAHLGPRLIVEYAAMNP